MLGKIGIAISAVALLAGAYVSDACTTIVVGSGATENHKILVFRNEDVSTSDWVKYYVYHKAKTYKKGATIRYPNDLVIPAPRRTYAYSATPDWSKKKGSRDFEEAGANAYNVVMTATNTLESNAKALKADPFVKKGSIVEANLLAVILPRIKSARQGMKLIGEYVTKYGTGEPNGMVIADTKGAWYLETGTGHHWIAIRVPKDAYLTVANGPRLFDVNLDDQENVMHSPGIFKFVTKNKLLDNPSRQHFDFAHAVGKVGDAYNTDRIWSVQHTLTPSVKQKIRREFYPTFMKPDHKVSLATVMRLAKSDYAGTPLAGKSKRPIGVNRTAESHILEVDPKAPKPLQVSLWRALANPLGSTYVPYYNTSYRVAPAYQHGTTLYDYKSAWWAFRLAGTFAELGEPYATWVNKMVKQDESTLHSLKRKTDRKVRTLLKQGNTRKAVQTMRRFNKRIQMTALRGARERNRKLLTLLAVKNNTHTTQKAINALMTKGEAPE